MSLVGNSLGFLLIVVLLEAVNLGPCHGVPNFNFFIECSSQKYLFVRDLIRVTKNPMNTAGSAGGFSHLDYIFDTLDHLVVRSRAPNLTNLNALINFRGCHETLRIFRDLIIHLLQDRDNGAHVIAFEVSLREKTKINIFIS